MPNASWTVVSVLLQLLIKVWSHGRLWEPPSRATMWRLGYKNTKNTDDTALFCGGRTIQWNINKGKCGICGDPYNASHPRDHEAGGMYGNGIITGKYKSGQILEAVVEVTANHNGYLEFKICPNNDITKEATEECLDKYPLEIAEGEGTKYDITGKGTGNMTVKLKLPEGLACSQCVFQWTYVTANNWGICSDNSTGLRCGDPETFKTCADIAIFFSLESAKLSYSPSQNDI